ncbi:MAG: trypsin-like peptidase domain-containing protein [Candidatus Shapirobacteria bacterium]|nr:trypsin-like peptidase domain-containing protein [Candidatus Shapirobacteria bacterium]
MKNLLIGLFLGMIIVVSTGVVMRIPNKEVVVNEETVITRVVEQASSSVVTVSISKSNTFSDSTQKIEQDIGTGFIISADGLIVTNKHVVVDTTAKYKVVIGKDDVENVEAIYRDPVADLAILKVNKNNLTPIKLGNSDKLKVGQTVIAIGTALGEFRSTVTTGVISGLGRGIEAGSPIEGLEKLDNVIQTDAAINPGNSGGPLLDSSGNVIGVNVATSQSGQNIGFALPISLVKESIDNFKTTGEFDRAFLGVAYKLISKQAALLNDVPQGAYVQNVVSGSSADKGGIKMDDIITEINDKKISDEKDGSLVAFINKMKIGDDVNFKVWRNKQEISLSVKMEKGE